MTLDRRERHFREDECGPAHLNATSAAERAAGKCPQASLETLSLIGHTASERRRPVALNEIMAAVEHQQSCVFQMAARPSRRVQRGA